MPPRRRWSHVVPALLAVAASGAALVTPGVAHGAPAVAAPAVAAPAVVAPAAADVLGDRLQVGASMAPGDALRSANGIYSLILQSDGNLVEYAGGRPMWTTSTSNKGGARLTLQTDGNLVLYTAAAKAIWGTFRYASNPTALILRNDGALYTARADGSEFWGVHPRADVLGAGASIRPGQTLYAPGLQYRLTLQSDGNLVLYSVTNVPVWTTATSGTMAALTMQTDGNLVLRAADGRVAFHTSTPGRAGATLTVGNGATAVVGVGATVAWRTPAKVGTVWRNQVLASGAVITKGSARLTMQTDGNLVRRDAAGAAVWSSGTASAGAYASVQSDGNLVVRSTAGAALWASGTAGTAATYLQVSAAGLAFLGNASRSPSWVEGPPNWAGLAKCESGGNPRAVNPAGYYGLYQFDLGTWASNGGTGNPIDASPATQTAIAATLYLARGRQPWPVCGKYL